MPGLSMLVTKRGNARGFRAQGVTDLLAIQCLLGPSSVISMLEVDKGIHAAREGDHIIHWAMYFKDSLQHSPWQPGVQVAQPQMLAGTCTQPSSYCCAEEGKGRQPLPALLPALRVAHECSPRETLRKTSPEMRHAAPASICCVSLQLFLLSTASGLSFSVTHWQNHVMPVIIPPPPSCCLQEHC